MISPPALVHLTVMLNNYIRRIVITARGFTAYSMGIETLTEKLGSVGMVEFIRLFDSGYGN